MKSYYRISPRGFANEDTILSAETAAEKIYAGEIVSRLTNDPSAWGERITRKEAERITAANRAAYCKGEANSNNPAGATEITTVRDYMRQF
jgi:hypothetical protein